MPYPLVECEKHELRPGFLVCSHVVAGRSVFNYESPTAADVGLIYCQQCAMSAHPQGMVVVCFRCAMDRFGNDMKLVDLSRGRAIDEMLLVGATIVHESDTSVREGGKFVLPNGIRATYGKFLSTEEFLELAESALGKARTANFRPRPDNRFVRIFPEKS